MNRATRLAHGVMLGVLALGFAATAHAGAESGFYIGGGVGNASVEATDANPLGGANLNFDESDAGYKLFAGFNFGVLPLINLAVEGGYVDFGAPQGTIAGQNLSHEVDGFNAFGLGGVNLGPLMLFAKAGLISWDADSVVGATTTTDSGTDAAYGAGLQFQLLSIGVRAEYERYEVSDLDSLDLLSASVTYTF